MAPQVRLFLIRHGETVDNVAQLYAGTRDSELTNHGWQQATRLGLHFKAIGLKFTHIFSSHLQRAAKTAGLIREAQAKPSVCQASTHQVPDVVQLPVLMEQDFGYLEGKKWHERPPETKPANIVDVESKDSMVRRADLFLDGHLLPLLSDSGDGDSVVAVVSHGIMLSALWKRLLLRLPPKSVGFSPELAAAAHLSLDHLGGWFNTGYLELLLERKPLEAPVSSSDGSSAPPAQFPPSCPIRTFASATSALDEDAPDPARSVHSGAQEVGVQSELSGARAPLKVAGRWLTTIQTVNGKDHLKGLKRTGGGVGSSRHDASQKNIDSFFKRRRV
ncbi:phosphoglycerate mutase-like protein, partial [Corynespora cassiicola Philippines]